MLPSIAPAFWALVALLAAPPVARDRIAGFPVPHADPAVPPSIRLIALAVDHWSPCIAGPRQTLHVPTINSAGWRGSRSHGASMSEASRLTCVAPIVAAPAKSAAAQSGPVVQVFTLTPAAVEAYPNDVRKAVFRDPDGNEVGVGGVARTPGP